MDQPLHSSRDRRDYSSNYSGGSSYRGRGGGRGGGGARGSFRGGRGRHNQFGGAYRNSGGGGGGTTHHHHHPYRREGRGGEGGFRGGGGSRVGGGGRYSSNSHSNNSNRFYAEPPLPQDATSVALRNVTHMLVRLGNWQETHQAAVKQQQQKQQQVKEASGMEAEMTNEDSSNQHQDDPQTTMKHDTDNKSVANELPLITLQDLVATQSQNVKSLTAVMAKKPQVFLQFQSEAVAMQHALQQQQQQPSQVNNNDNSMDEDGDSKNAIKDEAKDASSRNVKSIPPLSAHALAGPLATSIMHCVMAVSPLSMPVYAALTQHLEASMTEHNNISYAGFAKRLLNLSVHQWSTDLDLLCLVATHSLDDVSLSRVQYSATRLAAWRRLSAVARFWIALAAAGVIRIWSQENEEDSSEDPVPTAVQELPVSLTGWLRALVQAAALAQEHQAAHVAWLLLRLVTELLPVLQAYGIVPKAWLREHIWQPLQEVLAALPLYTSPYRPGCGMRAVLLHAEQHENIEGIQDEEEEEEEDDMAEEEEAAARVCDNWQELLQAVTAFMQHDDSNGNAKTIGSLALWLAQPWAATSDPPVSLQKENETIKAHTKLALEIYPTCHALTLLLGGHLQAVSQEPGQPQLLTGTTLVWPLAMPLDDTDLVGRLPLFGSPASPGDDDDQEDEEDEGLANPRLQSYKQFYGALDRVYLASAIRDILASHQVLVTETGVEKGSIKSVAEHLWSLRHAHKEPGMEYAMVEVLLAIICQVPADGMLLGHSLVSLARVLVELTKLDPALFSAVLVQAVHTLVEDYIPALTPTARHNLSRWFAMHLVMTQYQWPRQYWQHWAPFILHGSGNARGAFLRRSMELVLENTSKPEALIREHPYLARHVFASSTQESSPDIQGLESLQGEIYERIHGVREDPSLLLDYVCSDEVTENATGALSNLPAYWRTLVVTKALMGPLLKHNEKVKQSMERSQQSAENGSMEDDATDKQEMQEDYLVDQERDDVLTYLLETWGRYETLIMATLNRDRQEFDPNEGEGEMVLLSATYASARFSPAIASALIRNLQEQKVVSTVDIVRWCLKGPVLRWWEWACAALRLGLRARFDASSDYSGMVDSTGESVDITAKVDKAVSFIQPVLDLVLTQVVQVLKNIVSPADVPRKLTPLQVDLVEGTKQIIALAQVLFLDELWTWWRRHNGDIPMQVFRDTLDQSSIGKHALNKRLASLTDIAAPISIKLLSDSIANL